MTVAEQMPVRIAGEAAARQETCEREREQKDRSETQEEHGCWLTATKQKTSLHACHGWQDALTPCSKSWIRCWTMTSCTSRCAPISGSAIATPWCMDDIPPQW